MDFSMPFFPIHHQFLKLAHTHVHWVSDAIQPSHSLLSPSTPAFNLSQHQSLFQRVVLHIRLPKYWSFSCRVSPSNKYSGLISFRIDWFDLLVVQDSSPAPQFKSINSLTLSLLYGPTLTSIHDSWKCMSSFDYYRPLLAKWCLFFLICCLGLS